MNNIESLWKKGRIAISTEEGDHEFSWEAKVYDEGSPFGINGGRVSKLYIYHHKVCICSYDRGWDIKPASYEVEQIVNYITNYVYGSCEPSVHRDFVYYLINDWLEAEFDDEEATELQEYVRSVGVARIYEMYMFSDENLCAYGELTDVIKNLKKGGM